MADYLLDTNHASPLVTLGHPLRQRLLDRAEAGDSFSICLPVLTETLFGIGTLPRAKRNRELWSELRPLLPCINPDESDATFAAELQIELRLRGIQLGTIDALIAVLALRSDLVLLTKDKAFSQVRNLQFENWL